MKTPFRRAFLLALLPALAACGHTTSTVPVKTKAKPHATASVNIVKMPIAEGTASIATGATPKALPTGAPPAAVPSASTAVKAGPVKVSVAGYVFNESGSLVNGVTIYAHSLDPSKPFQANTVTAGGSYVFNNVPQGANIEFIAGATGWTARRRVSSFSAAAVEWNRCDFGSIPSDSTSEGAAYFLSNRPEIQTVVPVDGDLGVDASLSAIKLVLSESLDATNRTRLEHAIRILPANDVANHGAAGAVIDLATLAGAGYPLVQAIDGTMPYDIRKGSVFLQDVAHAAACTWNADGTEVTFALPGPLLTSLGHPAAYQVALVSAGPDQTIHDAEGNVLGSDTLGANIEAYPAAGLLVPATIYNQHPALATLTGIDGANGRWAATHQHSSHFEVTDVADQLSLEGVRVATLGANTQLAFKFTLPMAAYSGSMTGFSDATLVGGADALTHFTFALGGTSDDLKGVTLDRDPNMTPIDPRTLASLGDTTMFGKTFRFDPAAFVASAVGATPGSVTVSVDPENARQVLLTIVGKPHFFDNRAGVMATRVIGLKDPAGNRTEDVLEPKAGIQGAL